MVRQRRQRAKQCEHGDRGDSRGNRFHDLPPYTYVEPTLPHTMEVCLGFEESFKRISPVSGVN
jgi:hypothetical protein